MSKQRERLGVLVALGYVVPAVMVLLLVPFEAAIPLLPLFLVLLYALLKYRS